MQCSCLDEKRTIDKDFLWAGELFRCGGILTNGAIHRYQPSIACDTKLVTWVPHLCLPICCVHAYRPDFDNVCAALIYEPGGHGNYLSLLKLILRSIGTFWSIGEAALTKYKISTRAGLGKSDQFTCRTCRYFEHELKVKGSSCKQAFREYAKDFSLLVADPTRGTTWTMSVWRKRRNIIH